MNLNFDNQFTKTLPADSQTSNERRQVHNACYSLVSPTKVNGPKIVSVSTEAASLIDLDEADYTGADFLNTFSGNLLLDGMEPYAMCYGGHQFGNWAGQLGDGRAINLGEAINKNGERWALQLKGAGPTPYSRTADGLAVLRSSIREYVCSEAMHHLGVPTTRALSLMTSGEQVMRDVLYNGNPAYEPGAVVCRMAPSFIRFGSFQIFAARKEITELRKLTEFTIRQYYPQLLAQDEEDDSNNLSVDTIVAFFSEVCQHTATMIVDWMRVGFVHGVMNTDNMSIHGLTIDYGPYGWLDDFNPNWTPNTTDASQARYRFGEQANIALWNCYQLANALFPLIEETEQLENVLAEFQENYTMQWQQMMANKLGLGQIQPSDASLFESLESLLVATETDMTRFYRALANKHVDYQHLVDHDVFYETEHSEDYKIQLRQWLANYQQRITSNALSSDARFELMNSVNPKYVFRNYLAQQAIDKSEEGDHSMVNELLEVLRKPYDEQPQFDHYAQKRPEWARTKVGCSMLSCSS